MIPLAIPNLSGNEARYLADCVETNFVSSVGPFVERFEAMVADASGGRHAIATTSGTTGLHAALTAVGAGPGDLVILPSMTFIASANAISHCGSIPWLFDIEAESWTLDPKQVAAVLESKTERRGDQLFHRDSGRRVAAMMPVHTLGLPAQMPALTALARSYGIPIVVDAAAALGSTCGGKPPAALGADLNVFSFNGNKTVTAGGGGAVVGDDEELCALVRHLTTTARVGADYTHDRVGFNYRMTNLEAAVGCAQMECLDDYVAAKRRIAHCYNDALCDLPGVNRFPEPDWAESACWFSGVSLEPKVGGGIETVIAALIERGIGARPFWKPVHLQSPYADAPVEAVSVTMSVWDRVLTLPCSTHLSEADQNTVIAALHDILGANS